MKFLIASPPYYPRLDVTCVSDLINSTALALVERGHEVHILNTLDASSKKLKCCSTDWKNNAATFEAEHPGLFIHPITSPFKVADSYFAYVFGTSWFVNNQFSKLVEEVKPEVVHFHAPMFFGHQILRKRGEYLSVYTAHDYWFICQRGYLLKNGNRPCTARKNCVLCAVRSKRPPQLGQYNRGYKKAINDVDLILAPSNAVKDRLSRELNIRIECIPHFLPHHKQQITPSGYSSYFLYSGSLERHKGIFTVLEAFLKYSGKIDAKLIITGRGSLERSIKEFISANGLQEKVVFLGWVDKDLLWSLYHDALALVLPSINLDPAPTVIAESLSVGTPVIGSDQGGVPERVAKLDRNLIFKAGDEESLAKILVEFKKENYPEKKVKAICRKWFSVESYVSSYLEILKAALEDKAKVVD